MTQWSIQYTDESGGHVMRTTDDIGDVHATLEIIVADEERTAGYAGQTATWHGYEPRDEDYSARGNWVLDIVNLDTHREDGYTHEEWAEIEAMVERDAENDGNWALGLEEAPVAPTLAPKAERVAILADILEGLTGLYSTKPSLFVETRGTIPRWQRANTDIIVRQTNGFTSTLDHWSIRLYNSEPTITVNHDGADTMFTNPMDALVHMHGVMSR